MTNMRQKAPTERHARRNRYVAVVDLFRKKFGCTAAECLPICVGIVKENERLKAEKLKAEKLLQKALEVEGLDYSQMIELVCRKATTAEK
jgi:hypothetical protein